MKTYEIEFTKSAKKELKKLIPNIEPLIAKSIHKLRVNPRKENVGPMVDSRSWRLRIGECRDIYDISEHKLTVLIIEFGHHRDIYRWTCCRLAFLSKSYTFQAKALILFYFCSRPPY